MTTEAKDPQFIIKQAYQALKQNDKATAERLAWRAVKLAPELETPWLILATLADPDKSIEYVQKALQINPESRLAQEAFRWALGRRRTIPQQPIEKPQPEPAKPAPAAVAPTKPQTRPLKVPPAQRVEPVRWEKPTQWVKPAREVKPVRGLKPARGKKRRPFEFKRFIILLIAIDLILIGLVVTLILLKPKLTGAQQSSLKTGDAIPAMTLGGQSCPNYALQPESDGTWAVPPQWPGSVYWTCDSTENIARV